ncbi:MAG: hypothetical protein U1F83_02895 [Verrucomicrobiota bacterium]
MIGFSKGGYYHGVIKADLRISIKDYRRGKNLKVMLTRLPFGARRYWVRMNGERWPVADKPVSITWVVIAWRKALVQASG